MHYAVVLLWFSVTGLPLFCFGLVFSSIISPEALKRRHGAESEGLEQHEHYFHQCALIKKRAVLCRVCQTLFMDMTAHKSQKFPLQEAS